MTYYKSNTGDTVLHGLCPSPKSWHPVIVLDPEGDGPEQMAELLDLYLSRKAPWRDVLREYAKPKPPEPVEPTGHLAVVEDANGVRWLNWRDPRESPEYHERPWVSALDGCDALEWSDLPRPLTVLSEGVND